MVTFNEVEITISRMRYEFSWSIRQGNRLLFQLCSEFRDLKYSTAIKSVKPEQARYCEKKISVGTIGINVMFSAGPWIGQYGYLVSSLQNAPTVRYKTHRRVLPAIPINPSGLSSAEKLHA
jgi:hypothetical protein